MFQKSFKIKSLILKRIKIKTNISKLKFLIKIMKKYLAKSVLLTTEMPNCIKTLNITTKTHINTTQNK